MHQQNQVAAYYDRIGAAYDSMRLKSAYFRRVSEQELKFVMDHVGVGDSILEVGAGSGFFTRHIAERALRLVAVDASEAMVRVLSEEIRRSNFSAVHLPLEKSAAVPGFGQFDSVVCMRVLPHIADLDAALLQIRAALRTGGTATFDLWNDRSFMMMLRRMLRKQSPVFTRYHTLREMELAIVRAGFSIRSRWAWGYPPIGRYSMDEFGFRVLPAFAYSVLFHVRAE